MILLKIPKNEQKGKHLKIRITDTKDLRGLKSEWQKTLTGFDKPGAGTT
ncbi:MAG: hypothetical protein Q8918_00405 [Bacteroidota bacterium]|nr:hypothetical protein [Bacteroidota bacterium]MDP4248548.1 hypothetical protein [Bacteroidota bacterium]